MKSYGPKYRPQPMPKSFPSRNEESLQPRLERLVKYVEKLERKYENDLDPNETWMA